MQNQSDNLVKKYRPLAIAAGIGSILGSGIIVGLSDNNYGVATGVSIILTPKLGDFRSINFCNCNGLVSCRMVNQKLGINPFI